MTKEEVNKLPEGSIVVRADKPLHVAEPIIKRGGLWHLLGMEGEPIGDGFKLQDIEWRLDPDFPPKTLPTPSKDTSPEERDDER